MTKLKLDDARWPWLPAVLLLALALVVFSPVIFGGTFFWDDYPLLVNNAPVHDVGGLYRIWFTTENPDYFPLTSTLFWIEWRLFGNSAGPYHLVNALLHGGSGILLWRVLRQLHVRGAVIAALLFVAHPVNAESASWIAEGKNTLSVFLMLASVLVWVRSEKTGDRALYAGSLGLFVLALLAKTAVVMLPVAMMLVLWYQRRASVAALLRTAPFFVASLLLGAVTWWFQAHRSIQDATIRADSFASRLATAGCAVWFYLLKAFVPVGITFSYGTWDVLKAGALAFVPLVLLVLLLAGLWLLRGKIGRGFFVALAAYVAMLLPILGFVNVFFMRYSFVSDHWQYPAMPFFCAAVAGGAMWLARRKGTAVWNGVSAGFLALVALLALDSGTIAAVYRSPESLWQDVLAHDPNSWLAHSQLGDFYMERSRTDPPLVLLALPHLRAVTDLQPDLVVGYANLANAYVQMGQLDEAKKLYLRGEEAPVGTRRDRGLLHVNLGQLLRRQGDPAGAEKEFEKAVQENPQSTYGWLNVGLIREARGDLAGARQAYEQSVKVDELFTEPRLRLAALSARLGDAETARQQVKKVLQLEPDNVIAPRLLDAIATGALSMPSTRPAATTSAPAQTRP
jgi:tetratricopeptide (TPR) repeat protein